VATPYDADAINYDVKWEVLRWKLGAGSWKLEVPKSITVCNCDGRCCSETVIDGWKTRILNMREFRSKLSKII